MILADTKLCRDTSSLFEDSLVTLVCLIFVAAYLVAFTPHTVHNFESKGQSCSVGMKKWHRRWSHSHWVGGCKCLMILQKAMGSCTAQLRLKKLSGVVLSWWCLATVGVSLGNCCWAIHIIILNVFYTCLICIVTLYVLHDLYEMAVWGFLAQNYT